MSAVDLAALTEVAVTLPLGRAKLVLETRNEVERLRAAVGLVQGLLDAYGEESADEFLVYQLRAALGPPP